MVDLFAPDEVPVKPTLIKTFARRYNAFIIRKSFWGGCMFSLLVMASLISVQSMVVTTWKTSRFTCKGGTYNLFHLCYPRLFLRLISKILLTTISISSFVLLTHHIDSICLPIQHLSFCTQISAAEPGRNGKSCALCIPDRGAIRGLSEYSRAVAYLLWAPFCEVYCPVRSLEPARSLPDDPPADFRVSLYDPG